MPENRSSMVNAVVHRVRFGENGLRIWEVGKRPVPKRNGASLAADPTLTGVWFLPKQEALRPAFQCLSEEWPIIARRSRRRRFRRWLGLVTRTSPVTWRFRDRSLDPSLKRFHVTRRLR